MIDFLKNCGFNELEIQEIEESNSKANLYNLNCNEFDVIKMINYLRENKIDNINLMIRDNISIFFKSYEDFVNQFEKNNN